jgi:hypothetical protein
VAMRSQYHFIFPNVVRRRAPAMTQHERQANCSHCIDIARGDTTRSSSYNYVLFELASPDDARWRDAKSAVLHNNQRTNVMAYPLCSGDWTRGRLSSIRTKWQRIPRSAAGKTIGRH